MPPYIQSSLKSLCSLTVCQVIDNLAFHYVPKSWTGGYISLPSNLCINSWSSWLCRWIDYFYILVVFKPDSELWNWVDWWLCRCVIIAMLLLRVIIIGKVDSKLWNVAGRFLHDPRLFLHFLQDKLSKRATKEGEGYGFMLVFWRIKQLVCGIKESLVEDIERGWMLCVIWFQELWGWRAM